MVIVVSSVLMIRGHPLKQRVGGDYAKFARSAEVGECFCLVAHCQIDKSSVVESLSEVTFKLNCFGKSLDSIVETAGFGKNHTFIIIGYRHEW